MRSIEQLKSRAVEDSREEPKFFRALLDATVFVHRPVSDDSARLRLIQFVRPDGMTVLPFFSREDEADRAAQQAARVIAMTGRQLFELTRGATLMLDPNDVSCTLYPEEIAALLRDGQVTQVETFTLAEPEQVEIMPAVPPTGLVEIVRKELQRFSSAEVAYMVRIRKAVADAPSTLAIVVLIEKLQAEHMVRALATTLQATLDAFEEGIDVLTFDRASKPDWMNDALLEPCYVR